MVMDEWVQNGQRETGDNENVNHPSNHMEAVPEGLHSGDTAYGKRLKRTWLKNPEGSVEFNLSCVLCTKKQKKKRRDKKWHKNRKSRLPPTSTV